MLSDASAADGFLKNMATKEEIAQNEQFLLLTPCFQLYSIIVLLFKGSFQFCSSMFLKCRFVVCGKGLMSTGHEYLIRYSNNLYNSILNPFPQTTNLQQMTLITSGQINGISL